MQIARGLVALRERAQLTQVQAAERAGCSKATVSRYEEWQDRRTVKWATVKAIAEACDATDEERDALVAMAKDLKAGWWVGNPAVPPWLDPLVSFEAMAAYERIAVTTFVPGLLQTRAYARAVLRGQGIDGEALELEVDARMRRQERLAEGLRLWAVLDESVLRRVVGDEQVMAEQLAHLQEVARRPSVDIQILPFQSGPPAVTGAQFLVLGRDDERDPRNTMAVVYLELPRRGVYLDDPEDVTAYKDMFDRLRAQAAGPTQSIRLLSTARQEYTR
ncbi:helix-turn-helix domain-containing protein [Streptomyces millisiae]|uniref:Helix-turn-helix transcriptional regulator n=1 Tax=Streptomyces millisiae TaxID=3075542 RepID=A0ABU2LRT7_9ACTN|nr:helix-turn-helix transcriptional regulator [Streptomyces sp. DSM 44918]MDT0320305.1 helix-turn-helix transcriptional regulator [Streptomyces sp. DSM 44918]